MTRKKRSILLISLLVALVVLAAVAFQLWKEFVGFERFDEAFYEGEQVSYHGELWEVTLGEIVDDRGMVAYAQLKAHPIHLHAHVRSLAGLTRAEYDAWTKAEQIAFWINAYNALTLKLIIDHYPIEPGLVAGEIYPASSIRQIPGAWTKVQFLVMGEKMTLDEIEHQQLRAVFAEPRIHVALVCAAMSCPPLRNERYVGAKLDAQFDDQARRFLAQPGNFRVDRDEGVIYLSSIFSWFGEDFTSAYMPLSGFGDHDPAVRAVLNYVSGYVSEADAEDLRAGQFAVDYLDYDWSLNQQVGP